MSLACLLAWSGVCLCLAHVPKLTVSRSHDCAPESQETPSCESGCTAEDAVRARTLTETVPAGIIAPIVSAIESPGGSLSQQADGRCQAKLAPSPRPYVLLSVLLL